jgi:hypothetical protein
MPYHVIRCGSLYFYSGACSCTASTPFDAYTFPTYEAAAAGAQILNQRGCCGGNCVAMTINAKKTAFIDEITGIEVTKFDHIVEMQQIEE